MSVVFNATIGSVASGADIGDNIANSLMLDSGSSQYLSRTFGAPTNNLKWSNRRLIKRGKLGVAQFILNAGTGSAASEDAISFTSADKISFTQANSSSTLLTTVAVFRDPTAGLDVLVTYDSANATAADRLIIWVNGVRQSLTVGTYVSLNLASQINGNGAIHRIGSRTYTPTEFYDGYEALDIFVDGQVLTPSDFGRTSADTGQWVNKTYAGTYGNNGFKLDFSNSADLGNDVSGNNNDWTTNGGITSANQYTDTPTNNYCVLNPLANFTSGAASVGNLKLTTGTTHCFWEGTLLVSSGKWYWETTDIADSAGSITGIALSSTATSGGDLGDSPTGYGYLQTGNKKNNASITAYGASYTANDILGVALDLDAGTLTFYKNNATQGVAFSGLSGAFVPALGDTTNATGGTIWQCNFGAKAFAYTPPTGFNALCTANLPTPAILKPTNGFVAVTATETNIDSTLTAARSWADYVDIKKNRSNAEAWQWQFSHDSTNEYAVAASSLTRRAKSSNSGADNWVGYSIRIGAAYGTAAGSVSHTNGVATTITHSVGVSARQLILLFNRAGGAAVPLYHPDLTGGELLDLCTTAADAASTAITSVLSTSFQIGSATATGTYDYLVCSEISGFFDLGQWTGNASADGTYYSAGHKPAMLYVKALSTTDDHRIYDKLRPGYNVQGGTLLANTTGAETTDAETDLTAFGVKNRITTTPNAAQTYVTANWADADGKYATAR